MTRIYYPLFLTTLRIDWRNAPKISRQHKEIQSAKTCQTTKLVTWKKHPILKSLPKNTWNDVSFLIGLLHFVSLGGRCCCVSSVLFPRGTTDWEKRSSIRRTTKAIQFSDKEGTFYNRVTKSIWYDKMAPFKSVHFPSFFWPLFVCFSMCNSFLMSYPMHSKNDFNDDKDC